MKAKEAYEFWMKDSYFDEETKSELAAIREDEKEIEERFYRDLEFGTGGLRGILGAGTNRMNPGAGELYYKRGRAAKGRRDRL